MFALLRRDFWWLGRSGLVWSRTALFRGLYTTRYDNLCRFILCFNLYSNLTYICTKSKAASCFGYS